MATLNVKNFPESLYRDLKTRAKKQGRSLSRETTMMLQEQLLRRPKKYTLRDWPRLLGGAFKGVDVEKYIDEERNSW